MMPNRRALLVSAVLLLVPGTLLCADTPCRIRVLTYNIHHGEGTDGRIVLPRIAQLIRRLKPDLVALQEVDNKTRRTGQVDQASELARLTGMRVVFGRAKNHRGGQYGNVVLSRWPILATQNHPLPKDTGSEPRTAVAVRVRLEPEGPEVLFTSTHLEHTADGPRLAQANEINRQLAVPGGPPAILAGDLNAMPGSSPMKTLLAHWTDATAEDPKPTHPSKNPTRKIDYVLFHPAAAWRVVEAQVIHETLASDHCPLLVVLEFSEPR